MIQSMTAFSRQQNQGIYGTLTCELRSINHRYLEMSMYLPDALRQFEMPLRECVRQFITRGKIECVIRYQSAPDLNDLSNINTEKAKALCKASEVIASFLHAPAPIQPVAILQFEGVLQNAEKELSALEKHLIELMKQSLKDLILARKREGEELKQLFLQRLDLLDRELVKVRSALPELLANQRERLLKRFSEVKLELDANRLEQEMVIFAQKMDVDEEIERTETHILEIRRILQEGGSVGRRLDFLLQELNREANTLGSKSVSSITTLAAVEMKVLIEQIREQVQNVE